MQIDERDDAIEVATGRYRLRLDRARPQAALADADGRSWTTLSVLASVHRTDARDETLPDTSVTVEHTDHGVRLLIDQPTPAWDRRAVLLECSEDTITIAVEVTGHGTITDLTLAGGDAVFAGGACGSFRSSIEVPSLFVPTPSQPIAVVRPATSAATITVVGDAKPGRLHGIFSPGPLALALGRARPDTPTETPEGEWLALWLRCSVDEATFTALRYEPVDGGWWLRLPYEGHTRVDRRWVSPALVIVPVADAWQAVSDQRRDLLRHQLAPAAGPEVAPWWKRPIFCGWGAQCALAAAHQRGQRTAGGDLVAAAAEDDGLIGGTAGVAAPALARQDLYHRWLSTLADAGLRPGTVVIDDKWQHQYGLAAPDTGKWPDLEGWIADRHADGTRVLLWWKAWDPEGVPAEECIRDPRGRPVAVNPANPAYRKRLARVVTELLDPSGIGADGFKIDFSQRTPSGASLTDSGSWGIALLHQLLQVIADAARAVRPDALLITHTVHPWFADVASMIRLNDVLETDVAGNPVAVADQLRFRAEVASAALPQHLIDTDQWPMPNREEWRSYVAAQAELGVPALYYVDSIDNSGELLTAADHDLVARSWRRADRSRTSSKTIGSE